MSARKRGRPVGDSAGDTKGALIAAAREQFAAKGFGGASMRQIAVAAGVDPSLVSHYFGGKEGLLAATLDLPFNPAERLASAIDGGPDGFGERLIRTFVTSWDSHRGTFAMMVRSGLAGDPQAAPVVQVAREVVAAKILAMTGKPLQSDLIVSQILGLGIARYVVALDPLATASVDDVVEAYAPAIQALVD